MIRHYIQRGSVSSACGLMLAVDITMVAQYTAEPSKVTCTPCAAELSPFTLPELDPRKLNCEVASGRVGLNSYDGCKILCWKRTEPCPPWDIPPDRTATSVEEWLDG